MPSLFIRVGAPWALALCSSAVLAQPARDRADPLDAAASVPAARHESALKSYRRFDEAQAVPWRQANDTVERIGGWRSYARDTGAAAAASAAQPASAPRSEPKAPSGHGGHKH
jgi:hypothetical protein